MKIRAFTIVELLVVMILSGIILVLAWSVFTYFHQFGLEYTRRQEESGELLRMDEFMRSDLEKAIHVSLKGDSLIVGSYLEEAAQIVWVVSGKSMVRILDPLADTFAVTVSGMVMQVRNGISEITIDVGGKEEGTEQLYYEVVNGGTARDSSRQNSF